jgi:small subunit ribosomal protein S16
LDILTIAFKIYFNYVYLYLGRIKKYYVKIRLKRTGRKRSFYRIVLMENLARRDGGSVAEIGYYDPMKKMINFDKATLHKYLNCRLIQLIL